MKIAWLCKQKYMNHDVIQDQYGRLYHLPNELARRGHDVTGFCLNYTSSSRSIFRETYNPNGCRLSQWYSYPAGVFASNLIPYIKFMTYTIRKIQPDLLIGGSDCLHSILTRWVANKTNTPYLLDLYDNFESFGMSRIPGMKSGHRKAIQNAAGITTISDSLNRYIRKLAPGNPIETINSTITAGEFIKQKMKDARASLGLPRDGIFIGTAGSLSADRGTGLLYEVIDLVKQDHPQTRLVLAGPAQGNPPPRRKDIIYLGELLHAKIPALFNALDVALICMNPNSFGNYAFPQKAYEILSCKVPVIAAAVGPLQELFNDYPECLYSPGDIADLYKKIIGQIEKKSIVNLPIPTWSDQAEVLERFIIEKILSKN
ncbi:Glycosyltransferase involved in cell wall bisynthesis [Desulfopila aestuarii DSM 18488]|uniref:Glycosyltransferase involved in cell wall bisynthesis n=2 Tax=Desulfopila aestuarii TaxID=231440 RepID=A0A1M7Y1V7_9BACT|nr:Glycosyltransferase involved in cell wall bisynthesis [Desulfopila aestuarii DSM 18488]